MGSKKEIYFSILFICSSKLVSADSLIVETKYGKVEGETLLTDINTQVDIWRSIPYGNPPIGELRFKHPIPPDHWNDVLDTTGVPNTCYQKAISPVPTLLPTEDWLDGSKISEDCLYLTVVAPNPRPTNAVVIFWLYGGGNSFGSIAQKNYEFKTLASFGNVIVVAPQYRLSAFGFLYGGDSEAPGNAGLYDQLLSLRWVQDNIAKFGGDPQRVTLVGSSSGAASVAMHLTSPISSKLYSRAILLSGAPNMAYYTQDLNTASGMFMYLAQNLNCYEKGKSISNITNCLRNKSASDIQSKSFLGMFQPVPDGKIVQGVLSHMLDNIPVTPRKEILLGSTTDEASMSLHITLPDMIKLENQVNVTESDFETAIRRMFPTYSSNVQDLIIYNYKNWDDPNNYMKNLKSLVRILSDFLTDCDLQMFTEFASKANWNIYKYSFGYRDENMYKNHGIPEWTGVFTGIANGFFQGYPHKMDIGTPSSQDKELSDDIMRYFTNFAKTGNPNIDEYNKTMPTYWGPYSIVGSKGKRRYLNISNEDIKFVEDGKLNKNCILWQKFIPLINKQPSLSVLSSDSNINQKSIELLLLPLMTLMALN